MTDLTAATDVANTRAYVVVLHCRNVAALLRTYQDAVVPQMLRPVL